jgi:Protein of unknown function (DUF3489)
MQPGATSLNSNMIRDGHPACRLKPASPAVPAASAKEENKNNNDEKCLGIHDVQPFQCDGFGLSFSTISAFARMHIIWGDAIVPASSRSASSRAGRSFRPTGLMKRNEPIADLIEKAGREERPASPGHQSAATFCSLLSQPEGASIEEMMQATDWQQHSVRRFLAGTVKKKLGVPLTSSKPNDGCVGGLPCQRNETTGTVSCREPGADCRAGVDRDTGHALIGNIVCRAEGQEGRLRPSRIGAPNVAGD